MYAYMQLVFLHPHVPWIDGYIKGLMSGLNK